MAPIPSRQLLAWTLPTIAALLSYLWYKRKRIGALSDTGEQTSKGETQVDSKGPIESEIKQENNISEVESTPSKSYSRSLSGVESTPIDIVLPPQLRASRSAPKVISDEELDIEIEKIKSMKSGSLFSNSKIENSPPSQLEQEEIESKKVVVQESTPPSTELEENSSPINKEHTNKSLKNKMVRKEIEMVSEQINTLDISNNRSPAEKHQERDQEHEDNNNSGHKSELYLQRQSNERDSANHSPADVMLASPSLSIISDNHSEVIFFIFHILRLYIELKLSKFV